LIIDYDQYNAGVVVDGVLAQHIAKRVGLCEPNAFTPVGAREKEPVPEHMDQRLENPVSAVDKSET